MRHPGARGLACSSTVQVNVLVLGEVLDFFLKIVGLDADRAENPLSADVVIAMAANVDDLYAIGFPGRDARRNLSHVYARHDVVHAIFSELQEAVADIDSYGDDD